MIDRGDMFKPISVHLNDEDLNQTPTEVCHNDRNDSSLPPITNDRIISGPHIF